MSKYITNFETTAAYEAAESTLATPHVSLTKDNMQVHYIPSPTPTAALKLVTVTMGQTPLTFVCNRDSEYDYIKLGAQELPLESANGSRVSLFTGGLTPPLPKGDLIATFDGSPASFTYEGFEFVWDAPFYTVSPTIE